MRRTIATILLLMAATLALPAAAEPKDGATRHRDAVMLLEQARAIKQILPPLGDADRRYVETEQQAAVEARDLRRYRTLAESAAFAVWSTNVHTDRLLVALDRLVRRDYGNLEAEVTLWAAVAKQLGEGTYYLGLQRLGEMRLVERPVTVEGVAPQEKFHEQLAEIQDGIMLPYIYGALPQ